MKKAVQRLVRYLEAKGRLFDKTMKIRRRGFLMASLVLMIPIVVALALYFLYSFRIIEDEVSHMTKKSLAQTRSNLEYRLQNIENTIGYIMEIAYPSLNRNETTDSLSLQLDDYNALTRLLAGYQGKNMIEKLRMYVPDDRIYARQRDTFYGLGDLDASELDALRLGAGVHATWRETYSWQNWLTHTPKRILSCVFAMKSLRNYNTFSGILYADILEKNIADLMVLGLDYGENVFLMNAAGTILSHGDEAMIGTAAFTGEQLEKITTAGSGAVSFPLASGRSLVVFDRMPSQDWYLVATIAFKSIYGTGMKSFGFSGFLLLACVLAFVGLAMMTVFYLVHEGTIRRIGFVTKRIKEQGNTQFLNASGQHAPDGNTLSSLETNVDEMITVVRRLTQNYYREKLKTRDAQFRALQAQINPHFLYNTLDAISWNIMDGDKDVSIWLIHALSRYFRLSLSGGKETVTVREELELIDIYLKIQQRRFDNPFQIAREIDETALDCLIPKLTLQPIVENAVLHGLVNVSNRSGVLRISVCREDEEHIVIEIADNGVGMPDATVQELLSRDKMKGYGLYNVNERIKLLYGEEYGLSVESREGRGSVIIIRMKAIPKA